MKKPFPRGKGLFDVTGETYPFQRIPVAGSLFDQKEYRKLQRIKN